MKTFLKIFSITLLIITSTLFSLPLKDKFKQKVKKVTYSNGLNLIMMQRKNSPTAAFYIKFKVGGVDETIKNVGTAHLLEHMLFKGSKRIGTKNYKKEKKYLQVLNLWNERLESLKLRYRNKKENLATTAENSEYLKKLKAKINSFEIKIKNINKLHHPYVIKEHDALLYSINGQVGFNAYTSKDVTNYQIKLPVSKMELWAKIESDRLQNAILREYYQERAVVIEERRMRTESIGSRQLYEKFMEAAFVIHPYRMPTIGYMSNIPFLSKKETLKFFHTYYAPNNMVITIVGDIDFDYTKKLIAKYFGKLPASKLPPSLAMLEPKQKGERRVELLFSGEPKLIVGWHKPSLFHKDNLSFELLAHILTDGKSSLLTKKLVYENKSCLSINAWNGAPGERYTNLFMLFATPMSSSSTKTVEKQIYKELEKLKTKLISEKILQKYKTKMLIDFYRELNSNAGLADSLGYFELIYGNWEYLFDFYDKIQELSASDIQNAAKKYLVKSNRTVAVLKKHIAKKKKSNK